MRPLALAALGAAAYGVFLVALLPASFVAARVDGMTHGGLHLEQPRGSAWNGHARATIATPAGPLALDELRWRFVPSALLAGRVEFDLQGRSAGFSGAARAGRSFGAWRIARASASGDAAAIGSFLPLAGAWRPEGAIAFTAPELAWNDSGLSGAGTLEWRNAALSLSQLRPLGTYRLEVAGDGGNATLKLATVQGALRIAGQGSFAPPARVTFSGEARAEPSAAAALEPLLDLIGPKRADGSRALEWASR